MHIHGHLQAWVWSIRLGLFQVDPNKKAFDKIQAAGDMQPSLVAGGIKVALLTTVFGLIVAIILQIFYNYIVSKIDSIVNDMEDASITLIDILVSHKK